jgi:hypothetical protein
MAYFEANGCNNGQINICVSTCIHMHICICIYAYSTGEKDVKNTWLLGNFRHCQLSLYLYFDVLGDFHMMIGNLMYVFELKRIQVGTLFSYQIYMYMCVSICVYVCF